MPRPALKKHYKSTLKKAKLMASIVDRFYESGNQKRSLKGVWRSYVEPLYPMSYNTFRNYLAIARKYNAKEINEPSRNLVVQQSLFDLLDRQDPYRQET